MPMPEQRRSPSQQRGVGSAKRGRERGTREALPLLPQRRAHLDRATAEAGEGYQAVLSPDVFGRRQPLLFLFPSRRRRRSPPRSGPWATTTADSAPAGTTVSLGGDSMWLSWGEGPAKTKVALLRGQEPASRQDTAYGTGQGPPNLRPSRPGMTGSAQWARRAAATACGHGERRVVGGGGTGRE